MEDVALSTLKPNASSAGVVLAESAMDALGKLPNRDQAKTLFKNNATGSSHNPPQRPSHHGNFQVIVCDQSASGELSAVLGMFFFYGAKDDPGFLWHAVSSKEVQMQAQRNTYVLNEDIYGKMRDDITRRLGDRVKTLVAAINIEMAERDAFVV